jgi:hypothetical protein
VGYIYWIASYPKSGNTWMRAFLTNLVLGAQAEPQINSLADIAPDENLGRFHTPVLTKPISEASLPELAAARPLAHRRLAKSVEGFQFLKTHTALTMQFGHPAIANDVTAGAIYIVRNPLDVVVSYSKFRNWTADETIALLNQHDRMMPRVPIHSFVMCGSWSENVASWTAKPSERMLVVRYEDLLADPLEWFGRVAALLRVDVDGDRLKAAVELSSFEVLKAREQEAGFVEKPKETAEFFRGGRAGDWRETLTEAQIKAIRMPNEAMMRRFGYWDDNA